MDGHDNIGIFLAIISARGTKFDTKVDVHMTFLLLVLVKIVTINDGRHNRLPISQVHVLEVLEEPNMA